MVCACTVSLLSFYLRALSACQIVLLYNEELLRSGWFSHKNYNIIHNQGIYQRDVWEAGRGERRSAKEYKQRELEDEQSNMRRNTPGHVEFTGKEREKKEMVYANRVTRVMLTAPGIYVHFCMCVLSGKPQRADRVPTSPLSVCRKVGIRAREVRGGG